MKFFSIPFTFSSHLSVFSDKKYNVTLEFTTLIYQQIIIENHDHAFRTLCVDKRRHRTNRNIYSRGKFHRRSESAARNSLATDASLWFRGRLIPHYLFFVCLGDVCVFPSAFDSHLDHLFLDSLASSSSSSRASVTGKRLRRLFSETFPRFSNAKRWKRSETVGEESARKRRQRLDGKREIDLDDPIKSNGSKSPGTPAGSHPDTF